MRMLHIAVGALALATAACGGNKSGSAPQGQVAATVDGKEITVTELNAELAGLGLGANASPAAQAEALQRIIVRKLLVAEAEKRGLDKKPETTIILEQAHDLALVQALAGDFATGVPKVSDDEVAEFIRTYPANITQRKLLFVDQLFVPVADDAFAKALEPVHSLTDAEALLKSKNLPYRKGAAVLDTQALNPAQAGQIANVGTNDIFYTRQGKGLQISQIVSERSAALTGPDAARAARAILTQQRTGEQVQAQMAALVKNAKGRVEVNQAYGGKAVIPGK